MGTRLIVAVACLLWLASGAVAAFIDPEDGIMCAMPPAVAICVALVRRGQITATRAFIHGWHAGYHEAMHTNCVPLEDADCAVYLLSERRWTSA